MPFNKGDTDWIRQLRDDSGLPQTESTVVPAAVNATTDYEVAVFKVPVGASSATLSRASIFANAAIAALATNLFTIQFRQWRAGAAVGTFTGASTYATSTALAVLTEQALLSNAAIVLQPGDVITLQAVHSGTGMALPSLTAVVEVSPNVEPN